MSIRDVVYRVVHGYPGGVAALAARMGKNPNTLQSKINPNLGTHHTTDEELEQIQMFADSDEIAKEFAAQRNMVCIPVITDDDKSDMSLLDLYLTDDVEKGQWSSAVKSALADGMVDAGEYERINKEYMDRCAAGAQLMARLKSMVTERRKVARVK